MMAACFREVVLEGGMVVMSSFSGVIGAHVFPANVHHAELMLDLCLNLRYPGEVCR